MDRLLTLMLCIAVIFMLIGLLPVHGEEAVYDSVIRLHVLANSDTDEDQALKLEVRDAVLAYTEELLRGVETRSDAEALLSEHLDGIRAAATARLAELGRTDPVAVEFNVETYPTRQYGSCCFPSGDYLSLRVMIGEAAGRNWWCVLFPPLCIVTAEDEAPAATEDIVFESTILNWIRDWRKAS